MLASLVQWIAPSRDQDAFRVFKLCRMAWMSAPHAPYFLMFMLLQAQIKYFPQFISTYMHNSLHTWYFPQCVYTYMCVCALAVQSWNGEQIHIYKQKADICYMWYELHIHRIVWGCCCQLVLMQQPASLRWNTDLWCVIHCIAEKIRNSACAALVSPYAKWGR